MKRQSCWCFFSFAAGVLVDRTGQYYHVFFACSAVVASSAVFLMVSFWWLDKRDKKWSKPCQPASQPEPARSAINIVPGCQYSSVPTEGDKDKASSNGAECIASVWTCLHRAPFFNTQTAFTSSPLPKLTRSVLVWWTLRHLARHKKPKQTLSVLCTVWSRSDSIPRTKIKRCALTTTMWLYCLS